MRQTSSRQAAKAQSDVGADWVKPGWVALVQSLHRQEHEVASTVRNLAALGGPNVRASDDLPLPEDAAF